MAPEEKGTLTLQQARNADRVLAEEQRRMRWVVDRARPDEKPVLLAYNATEARDLLRVIEVCRVLIARALREKST